MLYFICGFIKDVFVNVLIKFSNYSFESHTLNVFFYLKESIFIDGNRKYFSVLNGTRPELELN